MSSAIPVIDLFAGPGGLNYGFATYRSKAIRFDVRLSIEKDATAWRTLRLRAFLRRFRTPPPAYYRYIRGGAEETIESLARAYPLEWAAANQETRQWTLGEEPFERVSEEINRALGNSDHWVLLGGPPCQAYSLAGRVRMKNSPDFSSDARHTLYREYLKIVAVHQPTFFVMENVKGILSSIHGARGTADSVFAQILEDLRNPAIAVIAEPDVTRLLPRASERRRYVIHTFAAQSLTPEFLNPSDFVIRSEDWSIPQRRHRVILLGVRADLDVHPPGLQELFRKETVSVEEVIGSMPRIRSRLSDQLDSFEAWVAAICKTDSPRIVAGIADKTIRDAVGRELRRARFPEGAGAPFLECHVPPRRLSRWIWRARLGGVVQHQSRSHMASDLRRYFYASCSARQTGASPKLGSFPKALLPNHRNALGIAATPDRPGDMDFADRFRVQVRGQPATTITSHIAKDGHYYIHYDPSQCRSLTVREAARIQTFPDDYYFEGNRTEQYHQIGNAVPPLLACKLAAVVANAVMQAMDTSRKGCPAGKQGALEFE